MFLELSCHDLWYTARSSLSLCCTILVCNMGTVVLFLLPEGDGKKQQVTDMTATDTLYMPNKYGLRKGQCKDQEALLRR